jgi:hypothetical protein
MVYDERFIALVLVLEKRTKVPGHAGILPLWGSPPTMAVVAPATGPAP